MKTEKEMMDSLLNFARQKDEIRVVGMEGSRVHPDIKKDALQDYDITYVVTDMDEFVQDEDWLEIFGKRIFMQKPEAMTLFESQLGNWFSYLMLLEDGNRIDLKIVPVEELDIYLSSETLIKILLDKDNLVQGFPLPSNETYHVQKPSLFEFDDSCNEFWWICTYAAKGICREEFLYASDYLNQVLRTELYRMISWKVGCETGFSKSVGKSYRFLEKNVSQDLWKRIVATYDMASYEKLWETLFSLQELFREVSKEVAEKLDFPYPDYDESISAYTKGLYEEYK